MNKIFLAFVFSLVFVSVVAAESWTFRPSTYTHDPDSGQRVTQYRQHDFVSSPDSLLVHRKHGHGRDRGRIIVVPYGYGYGYGYGPYYYAPPYPDPYRYPRYNGYSYPYYNNPYCPYH